MEKSTDLAKKHGYLAKKNELLRGARFLQLPRPFLDLDLTPGEFMVLVRFWDWFNSPEVKSLQFVTSRHRLAEVTGLGDQVTKSTLQKLRASKALLSVSTSFGLTTYMWNVEFLRGGVSEFHSGGEWNSPGPWVKITRPLSEIHPASIIYILIIPFYIPSYTALSRHSSNVENPTTDLRSFVKESKVALRAGIPKETLRDALRAGLPIKKVVGLADAILNAWIKADLGGTYFLQDIMLILNKFKVNLFESENITAVLYSILKNGENLHQARKQTPNYFDNEDALLEHYYTMYLKHEEENHG